MEDKKITENTKTPEEKKTADKKKIKIIAIVAAVVLAVALIFCLVFAGFKSGKLKFGIGSVPSEAQIDGKRDAKSIIADLKTEDQEVAVENYPKRIVNVVINDTEERLEVKENPETGALNGIELMVSYTEDTREEALEVLFADAKRIMKACIPTITEERMNGIIIRFRQSIPEITASTTCTEKEGAYSFAVSYFPDKAYFVVS